MGQSSAEKQKLLCAVQRRAERHRQREVDRGVGTVVARCRWNGDVDAVRALVGCSVSESGSDQEHGDHHSEQVPSNDGCREMPDNSGPS